VSGRAEYPAVSRWRVRHALRKAREAKGLTQQEVADHFEWSLSKVQRIESGDVSVSANDLRSLLDLVGVTDTTTVQDLLDDSRISRRQRWIVEPEVREHLTPAYGQLLEFEATAAAIRLFCSEVVPGFMQTRRYADAVVRFFNPRLPAEALDVRVGFRMQRRQTVLDGPDRPAIAVVLAEQALKMEVGGVDVMAEQLRDLAEIAKLPNVTVRVLPTGGGGLLGIVGSFALIQVGGDDADAILYRDGIEGDRIDDGDEVMPHRDTWDRLDDLSLSPERSLREIIKEAAALEARSDRP
jgi:transcriptional regulator with XRE-family HTH domain